MLKIIFNLVTLVSIISALFVPTIASKANILDGCYYNQYFLLVCDESSSNTNQGQTWQDNGAFINFNESKDDNSNKCYFNDYFALVCDEFKPNYPEDTTYQNPLDWQNNLNSFINFPTLGTNTTPTGSDIGYNQCSLYLRDNQVWKNIDSDSPIVAIDPYNSKLFDPWDSFKAVFVELGMDKKGNNLVDIVFHSDGSEKIKAIYRFDSHCNLELAIPGVDYYDEERPKDFNDRPFKFQPGYLDMKKSGYLKNKY
jgi:hypothetical protein